MSRRFIGLDKRMLIAAALAVAAAVAVFCAVMNLGTNAVDDHFDDEAFLCEAENALCARLQARIKKLGVSATDADAIDEILSGTDIYAMYLIRDGVVIYDSAKEITGVRAEGFYFEASEMQSFVFADGEAQAILYADVSQKYYLLVYTISWVAAAAAFVVVFTIMIRRRIAYILTLERDMRILEGGQMEHEVSVEGNDELSALASSINEMRLSILERQRAQEQAEAASRNLVAAMSHDLRTPLTSLIGYLELLSRNKCSGDQRARFTQSALDKAARIKSMSDELFDYALGMLGEGKGARNERIEMRLFIDQVVSDERFSLENAGLSLSCAGGAECFVRASGERLLRVFDNLFSNARKYASPCEPIQLSWTREDKSLRVDMSSRVRKDAVSGTGLGLASCEALLCGMGGSIAYNTENGVFKATFRLPLYED